MKSTVCITVLAVVPEALRGRNLPYERRLTHTSFVTEDDPEYGASYPDGVAFILEALRTTREPIELKGKLTRGSMVLHPWKRFAAPPASTTRAGSITATDRLDAAACKRRFCQLVFVREDCR